MCAILLSKQPFTIAYLLHRLSVFHLLDNNEARSLGNFKETFLYNKTPWKQIRLGFMSELSNSINGTKLNYLQFRLQIIARSVACILIKKQS